MLHRAARALTHGTIVAREPIPDADAKCLGCGARSWFIVERRAEPEADHTRWRAVACVSCGGVSGGWSSAGRRRPERPVEPPEGLFEGEPTLEQVLAVATFPIIAPDGEPSVPRYSYFEGRLTGVVLKVGGVEVETDTQLGSLRHAADLAMWLCRSEQSCSVQETVDALAATAVELAVDGDPVAFTLIDAGELWIATTAFDDRVVYILARGVVPADDTLG